MKRSILVFTVVLSFIVGLSGLSYGKSSYATSFKSTYPNSPFTTAPKSSSEVCTICHAASGPPLNSYGSAYSSNNHNFASVSTLDSDGDTFNNVTEINAGTFPGNASSKPAPATDTTAPTVTGFSIPATASSLTVSITTFTATDNVGVSGYLLTESATKPAATAAGWSGTKPANYTFASAGAKTLYGWAKDAAGNVSNSLSAGVTITITTTDTTAPTVTGFSIPSTASSLTVSITTFTATDNVGVSGYLLTESATKPAATAAGWSGTKPANYTFASAGAKTLYGWAKDAAGNVSNSLSAGVTITITTTDTTAPTVTGFSIPATSGSLTVSITTFTASDNVGVTGYKVTETSTAPTASATGWSASAPTSYTCSSAGAKTLYAWAKDAAGKVSASKSASVTITIATTDTTAPTVTGFSIPATASSLTVSITTFTATDNVGVSGYLVNESATKPAATATGWSGTKPANYTFASAGAKTLYGWAKDAAGNVSNGLSSKVTITITAPGPTVTSLIGVFKNGKWFMDLDGNDTWNDAPADAFYHFGQVGDKAVVGDWDGSGVSKIGVFRNGKWLLDIDGNGIWDPGVDVKLTFGKTGDKPVVGDWDGSGISKIGVFRNGKWLLDLNGNGTWEKDADIKYAFGQAGDKPVVGDWDGSGVSRIGIARDGAWYMDMDGNGAWDTAVDVSFMYKNLADGGTLRGKPVVGDWDGSGVTRIGVVNSGVWYLDANGDGVWDPAVDVSMTFGPKGTPVAGAW